MRTRSLLRNVHHRVDDASCSLAYQAHSCSPKLLNNLSFVWNCSRMGSVHRLEFKSNAPCKFIASKNIQSDMNYILKNTCTWESSSGSNAVVGNHRAAAGAGPWGVRYRAVSFSRLNALKHFCNDRRNYFRTFCENERIIVQLLSHKSWFYLGVLVFAVTF